MLIVLLPAPLVVVIEKPDIPLLPVKVNVPFPLTATLLTINDPLAGGWTVIDTVAILESALPSFAL